ncbi:MAG: hypothetical protein HKO62_08255 [Gammaproteobacteria bacterium]|nr:hypothetical protein [Gammaproteobacteria bacterium]NNM00726.1 hypothetical protein [Gammaproteobacteria bacterium]
MTENAAALVVELRARLGAEPDAVELQVLYEAWAKRQDWRLDTEAVPLIVGVPPEDWAARLAAGGGDRATALTSLAAADLACAPDDSRPAVDCCQWARRCGIPLAGHLDLLMQFIGSALRRPDEQVDAAGPELAPGPEPQPGAVVEVLGAALRLLARDRANCTGASGRPDADRMVDLILATAAGTFAAGRPPLEREAMVTLLARWL